MSRTIFIGDLHGCWEEAAALLKKCNVSASDHVIFLGDYVDRGLENAKCCDLVREREQIQGRPAGILGNHESRHLEHEDHLLRKGRLPEQIPPTHVATRAQLKPEHYDWFRSLPLYLRASEHNAVAVHAGVFPGRSIESQEKKHLLHIQMIRPYDFDEQGNMVINTKSCWPSRAPDNTWRFWTHFWDGPELIVFGHSVFDQPLITDRVAGIDGGAVFGRQLHAFILPEREVITVNGTTDFGKGHRGTETKPIMTYLVHNDVSTYS